MRRTSLRTRQMQLLDTLLIVEDAAPLGASLSDALRPCAREIGWVSTAQAAIAAMRDAIPDLIVLDVALPDGSAFDVLDAMATLPRAPAVVAMSGTADPAQSFMLALRGVRQFVSKPFSKEQLLAAITEALKTPPDLVPLVRQTVGMRGLHEVEEELRSTMLSEALARACASRRGAAQLLSVSRQLLQHMLRKLT